MLWLTFMLLLVGPAWSQAPGRVTQGADPKTTSSPASQEPADEAASNDQSAGQAATEEKNSEKAAQATPAEVEESDIYNAEELSGSAIEAEEGPNEAKSEPVIQSRPATVKPTKPGKPSKKSSRKAVKKGKPAAGKAASAKAQAHATAPIAKAAAEQPAPQRVAPPVPLTPIEPFNP